MLKTLVNEAHLVLDITTTGPLLIKSGYSTVSGPDMTPVLTYRNGELEVFLPGSSLKGVFRSYLEKVISSMKKHVVCNPFLSAKEKLDEKASTVERRKEALLTHRIFCGDSFKGNSGDDEEMPSEEAYRKSCPACRLFGSTSFIGRIAIGDAYLVHDEDRNVEEVVKKLERRDGVGIDRLTGGASDKAKFELEVVTTGVTFRTDIHLRNFEIWQLGMLFVMIQDMKDELIRIGSGRSRGLGKVRATISNQEQGWHQGGLTTATIRRGQELEPEHELWGLGRWLKETGTRDELYGTRGDDFLGLSPSVKGSNRGIRSIRTFKDGELETLKEASIEKFITCIQQWKPEPPAPARTSPTTGASQRG